MFNRDKMVDAVLAAEPVRDERTAYASAVEAYDALTKERDAAINLSAQWESYAHRLQAELELTERRLAHADKQLGYWMRFGTGLKTRLDDVAMIVRETQVEATRGAYSAPASKAMQANADDALKAVETATTQVQPDLPQFLKQGPKAFNGKDNPYEPRQQVKSN